jgi:CRAL/TRIO domain
MQGCRHRTLFHIRPAMQNYYPEHLGQMLIINAPLIFKVCVPAAYRRKGTTSVADSLRREPCLWSG